MRRLHAFLAAVLLVQMILAPALCMAQPVHLTVEICTAEGMRSMALDLGDEPPPPHHAGFCALCAGLPQGAEAPTPVLPTAVWLAPAPASPPSRAARIATQARAPPPQPRGPPVQA